MAAQVPRTALELVEFGPDDTGGIDDFVRVACAGRAVDTPWLPPLTPYRLEMEMRHGWDGETGRCFLARAGGEVVGTVDYFGSEYDNPDLAWVELQVAPDHRGQGWGRPLVAALEELALTDGRPLLTVGGWDSPAAVALGAGTGYPVGSIGVHRVQDLDGSSTQIDRFGALRDEAALAAAGYDVLRLAGSTPEDLLDGVVRASQAINDSPLDDLEYEDEFYDLGRVRAYEEAQRVSGFRFRRVIAVERTTGEVAGHTVISVDAEQPAYAEQHDTAVVPAHRGHRLGLLLKSEMLCWLAEEEPGLRSVHTSNAGSNDHMIAVNEALGYRMVGRKLLFQRRLGAPA
jgi:GNAT superfamily N-acetyltransferase